MTWAKTGSLKGADGDAGVVVHQQTSPASTWSSTHGLGRKPHLVAIYQNGVLVFTDVEVDTVHVVATFPTPETGEMHIF